MSARLSRKEIKRDEFVETVEHAADYTRSHLRTIIIAIGAVIAVGLIVLVWALVSASRARQGNASLTAALDVAGAEIDPVAADPQADPPTFASEAAREARAKELFEETFADYGGTEAGAIAGVYLAGYAAEGGEVERARELWSDFLGDYEGHALAGEVALNLARLDLAQGNAEEVAGRLEEMLASSSRSLPEVVILFELGKAREELGRTVEATSVYRRIVEEHPQSAYAQLAQQRIDELGQNV